NHFIVIGFHVCSEDPGTALLRAPVCGASVRAEWPPRSVYSRVDTIQAELLSSKRTRKGFQPWSRIFIEMSAGCSASDANKSDLTTCPWNSTRIGQRRRLIRITASLPYFLTACLAGLRDRCNCSKPPLGSSGAVIPKTRD